MFWGLYALMLLYGDGKFTKHWLFYQNSAGIFNAQNTAGDVTARAAYLRFIVVAIVVGFLVGLKRVWMGYHLGGRMYCKCIAIGPAACSLSYRVSSSQRFLFLPKLDSMTIFVG